MRQGVHHGGLRYAGADAATASQDAGGFNDARGDDGRRHFRLGETEIMPCPSRDTSPGPQDIAPHMTIVDGNIAFVRIVAHRPAPLIHQGVEPRWRVSVTRPENARDNALLGPDRGNRVCVRTSRG